MGQTNNLNLPYPENTDPLANIAVAIQALANAVDAAHPKKWKAGQTTAAVDASGDVTITHGLGVTPTAVIACNNNNNLNVIVAPHTYTSTTFKVRYRSSSTAAAVGAGASVATAWQAFA